MSLSRAQADERESRAMLHCTSFGGATRTKLQSGLGRGFRFAPGFRLAHPLAPLSAVGERLPRRLGPAATLAHMLERRRFRLGRGLIGARLEELEVGTPDNRPGHDHSAWGSSAWSD